MHLKIPKFLKTWDILFFILLIGISYLYSYNEILWMRPYSFHQWRQCDCLSITLNYYQEGMHFWTPSLNSCGILGDGKTCPSECPILYYTVACLWSIFGCHEFIYRLLEIVIGFSGLYALYRLAKELLQDGAWALIISLLLFSSPIFAIYTNNFITDTPALSIVLIAWYYFARYYKTKRLLFYNIAIILFPLAGLLKITALLSFIPLIAIFLWELFFKKDTSIEHKIFTQPLKQGVAILLLLCGIFSWVAYSKYYSSLHNPGFFSSTTRPIWNLDKNTIFTIANKFYHNLLPQYFNFSIILLTLILFTLVLINFRKVNRFYYWLTSMLFTGCILYILLWFYCFDVHDYYLITPLIFVPAILISFFLFLKENYFRLFNSRVLKIVFALFLGFNLYYCAVQINLRYKCNTTPIKNSFLVSKQTKDFWDWFHWDYENHLESLETITPYLRSIGISRNDKVVSIPDESLNISLYLMDQKGFDDYSYVGVLPKIERMKKFIQLGTTYLVVSDTSSIKNDDWLKPFLKNKIGSYKSVSIYDLRNI